MKSAVTWSLVGFAACILVGGNLVAGLLLTLAAAMISAIK